MFVEQRAHVVEAVADFVADHRADRAVIHRIVGGRVEERRLQDRGREDQAVFQRHIQRVDLLRQHVPLAVVHRLAQLGQVAAVLEQLGTFDIAHRIVAPYLERAVVAPGVRVAHGHGEPGDLGLGVLLGLRAHPRQRVDALAEGGDDVLGHRFGARLGLRTDVFLHVALAHRFAQRGVGGVDATLPALALLWGAFQGGAIEAEARVGKRLGQVRRGAVERAEAQVVLPGLQRLRLHQRRQSGHRLRLPDDEVALRLQPGGFEKCAPVQAGCLAREVGLGPGIGAVLHVVGLLGAGMHACDGGFQRQDALGLGRGIGNAGKFEHVDDVGAVRLAHLRHAPAIQIEAALGHAQAALHQVRHIPLRMMQVLRHPEAEQAVGVEIGGIEQVHIGAQLTAKGARQGLLVLELRDGIQGRLHRAHALGLDAGLVHVGGVVVANLLVFAGDAVVGGVAFDDVAAVLLGLHGDAGEAVEAGAVFRNLRGLDPGAVGVAEEVVARRHAAVHAGHIETEVAQLRSAGRRLAGIVRRRGAAIVVAGGSDQQRGHGGGDQDRAVQRDHAVQLETGTDFAV